MYKNKIGVTALQWSIGRIAIKCESRVRVGQNGKTLKKKKMVLTLCRFMTNQCG